MLCFKNVARIVNLTEIQHSQAFEKKYFIKGIRKCCFCE